MWDTLLQFAGTADTSHLTNPQEDIEATTQILTKQKTLLHAMDIAMIQIALMEMLLNIKTGIQTQTPVTELATRQIILLFTLLPKFPPTCFYPLMNRWRLPWSC